MNCKIINSFEYRTVCILFFVCTIILTSCHTSPINPEEMIGKSRTEILPVLCQKGLRGKRERFFVITKSADNSEHFYFFKNIKDAQNDEKIMKFHNWGFRKREYDIIPITFFIIPYETRCFLYFEDDKVVRYEYSYFYE